MNGFIQQWIQNPITITQRIIATQQNTLNVLIAHLKKPHLQQGLLSNKMSTTRV